MLCQFMRMCNFAKQPHCVGGSRSSHAFLITTLLLEIRSRLYRPGVIERPTSEESRQAIVLRINRVRGVDMGTLWLAVSIYGIGSLTCVGYCICPERA